MSPRTIVTIPKHVRQQVNELIERGVVSTFNNAVNLGLLMLIHDYKLQRWDDQAFSDYQAGLLTFDSSGVLVSRAFKKDLIRLSQDIPEIRRHVRLLFPKLFKRSFGQLEVSETDIKDLYIVGLMLNQKYLKLIFRKQGKQIIACRVGYTTELL